MAGVPQRQQQRMSGGLVDPSTGQDPSKLDDGLGVGPPPSQGLTQPVMFGILARAVSAKQQGISIGLRTTANRLATLLVPIIMGVVADAVGIEASFLIVGGSLIALCGVAALVVRRIPGLQT